MGLASHSAKIVYSRCFITTASNNTIYKKGGGMPSGGKSRGSDRVE